VVCKEEGGPGVASDGSRRKQFQVGCGEGRVLKTLGVLHLQRRSAEKRPTDEAKETSPRVTRLELVNPGPELG